MDFDLTLSPDTIQEYAAASDRSLTAPSVEINPTFRAGKEAGLGSWSELLKLRDTNIVPTKAEPTNPNKFNFVLTFEVLGPDDGGYMGNVGRTHVEYMYIDKAALASTDPQTSGAFKRRLSTLNSLLSACGMDLTAGVASYKDLLTGDKPLLGTKVVGVVRKWRSTKTGDTGCSLEGFTIPA